MAHGVDIDRNAPVAAAKSTAYYRAMYCTIVQSAVLRSHVVSPSVCDVGGS